MFSRISAWRDSCDSATTGTWSSRASALSPRVISLTSWTRLASREVDDRLHQLQVVDDDQVQAGLRLQPARLGAQLHGADVGRVVDVDGRLGQRVHRRRARRVKSISSRKPVRSRCESMLATRAQQAQHELLLAHLEREDADRLALADRRVLRDVQREAGLADAGPGGEDDQVALLQSAGQRVQVRGSRCGCR